MLHTHIPSALIVALALQCAGCGDDSSDSTDSAGPTSSPTDTTAGPPPGTTSSDESASGTVSESGTTDGVTPTTSAGEPLTTGDTSTTTTGDPDTTTTTGDIDTTATTGDTTGDTTTGMGLECSDGVAWTRNILTNTVWSMFSDILADPDDNLLVSGWIGQFADFGGGPVAATADAFLAKYGPAGELLWLRTWGDESEQIVRSVALAPNGDILVTGSFSGQIDFGGGPLANASYDVFLARLTPAGEHVWSHAFGGPGSDYGFDVASDSAGDVILAAQADAGIDFGDGVPGPEDSVHLAKFTATGGLLWRRTYTAKNVLGRSVAVGPADEVVFVGEFNNPVDFGVGLESPLAGDNIFVLKLDADGQFTWLRQNDGAPDGGSPIVVGVDIDAAGAIHLAGRYWGSIGFGGPLFLTQGGWDGWIARLSPAGDHVLSSAHGSGPTLGQFASDVATNSAGATAVSGSFVGSMSFDGEVIASIGDDAEDIWVTRQAPDGAFERVRSFGGLGSHYGDVVDIGEDGSVWLGGIYNQTFSVGDDVLTPAQDPGQYSSAYLIRLCP